MDTPGSRLKWAREHKTSHATATDAARAFGWIVSTYLGHENGDRTPSRDTAMKYAKAYKVPWEWILEGGPLNRRAATGPIPTRGEVAAGQWLDVEVEINSDDFEQYPIAADSRYPHDAQYGLIVRGTSMNRVAENGDVLHCLDLGRAAVEPDEDDIVIVERRRHQQGQKEVTAKRIRKRGRVITLAPDSTDAKWKPIELDTRKPPDNEEIAVIALVLAVYRQLRKRK